jgi:hypothetical protein
MPETNTKEEQAKRVAKWATLTDEEIMTRVGWVHEPAMAEMEMRRRLIVALKGVRRELAAAKWLSIALILLTVALLVATLKLE